jgi:cytochrome-b5 reductase
MFVSMLRSSLRRSTATTAITLNRNSLKEATAIRRVHTGAKESSSKHSKSKSRLHLVAYGASGLLGGMLAGHYFSAEADNAGAEDANLGVLSEKDFNPFELLSKEKYNHDSSIYHFRLKSHGKSELPVSFCMVAKIDGPDGKPIIRPYTPVETGEKSDVLTFLVKTYPEGKLSRHIDSLKPGDKLLLKGPIKKLKYEPNMKKHVSLVAGGSGITPCLQIMDKIFGNPEDKTKVTLLFANRTPEDILLKEKIDAYKKKFHDRMNIVYFVDKQERGWNGEVGLINKDKLQKYLPPPSIDNLVYVCGPPKMYESLCGNKAPDYSQGEVGGALKELGYTKDNVYKL